MREMVFNTASAVALNVERSLLTNWLTDTVIGMSQLFSKRIVGNALRIDRSLLEIECLTGYTLDKVVQQLRISGHREEYLFFVRLATKVPLLHEVDADLISRFYGCEGQKLPDIFSKPLVFCAISDGIAVGFPSGSIWDNDRCVVEFRELTSDETICDMSEEIDQLSRSKYAIAIVKRHLSRIQACTDPSDFWKNRKKLFPDLFFGPDVEANLRSCAAHIGTIRGKLVALNRSAREWRESDRTCPKWLTRVSPESQQRMNNEDFRNSRKFHSYKGGQEIFEWHARYGDGGRIHFRFDHVQREIEVGYIGPHLPP